MALSPREFVEASDKNEAQWSADLKTYADAMDTYVAAAQSFAAAARKNIDARGREPYEAWRTAVDKYDAAAATADKADDARRTANKRYMDEWRRITSAAQ